MRDAVSSVVVGGEHWKKFKLKKDPEGAAKFQEGIDHSTAKNELVDVIKSRRRDDWGVALRFEATTVKIEFPSTDPTNALSSSNYSGRSWVSICLEGDDAGVLQQLQTPDPSSDSTSPLNLLRAPLQLCLQIRFDSIAHSCHESFFPVLGGYPSFLRALTRPSSALLPGPITPLLTLLDILPPSQAEEMPSLLPQSLYAPHSAAHPTIAKHLHAPPSSPLPDSRVVPYLPLDVSSPADVIDPIRARRHGSLLNLDRVLLHSPPFAQGWNSLCGQLRGSGISISPRLKELAICVVAVLNEAEYEFYQHLPPWREAGGTEEQSLAVRMLADGGHEHFTRIWEEVGAGGNMVCWDCFDPLERDIIQLTIEMTKHVKTSPDLMRRLQGEGSSSLGGTTALVEMTGVIAGYNMVSRFLVAMDISAAREGEE